MKAVRWILGLIVMALHFLTLPRRGKRTPQHQQQVEEALRSHSLYQLPTCPFCVKVRRAMRRLNLPIELRDVRADGRHRQDLINGGGKMKVPCLRIDHEDGHSEWMYESDEIVAYLQRRFPLEP
ncbi:glutaredoxin [Marinobacterium iners]|uniref:glutaredoxin family protein n=1 Tax=Marinobacterium iners TaxID=48076 RepID=UPI001A8E2C89|nr:glutathione S-transferase N-terminal domain-containing protein [Marinobacterium iners]QSR34848.1 glutaredoxin [Marinobacterium iners]